jgi:hypothetical protein
VIAMPGWGHRSQLACAGRRPSEGPADGLAALFSGVTGDRRRRGRRRVVSPCSSRAYSTETLAAVTVNTVPGPPAPAPLTAWSPARKDFGPDPLSGDVVLTQSSLGGLIIKGSPIKHPEVTDRTDP